MFYFFKKIKKPGNIIILHLCAKNLDYMIYSSWDIECDRLKSVIMGHLSLFDLPPKKKKKCNFEKLKKLAGYHYFTHVYQKTTIIWGTAPKIQSESGIIFYHFGGFFALLLPNKPKNRNFKQMKKVSGDVIILHMCSKNHDDMMYASWDMECDRHNFLPGDIIILHSCTINEDHMMHCSWDIKARRTESIFWKNEEYAWRYYYFTLVYYKWRLYDAWFLRYGAWWIYYFVIFHFGVLLPPPPSPGLTTPSPPNKEN